MIESRASAEPLELVLRHGVLYRDAESVSRPSGHLQGDLSVVGTVEELFEAIGFQCVTSTDTRVVCFVGKPQGKDALFLENP